MGVEDALVPGSRCQLPKKTWGKQSRVLGKHAEKELVEEVSHLLGLMPTTLETFSKRGELARGLSGNVIAGLPRSELLGMLHEGTEDPERLLGISQQVGQGEPVHHRRSVREVGVNLEAVEVADHQQRGVIKRLAVLEKLTVGCRCQVRSWP